MKKSFLTGKKLQILLHLVAWGILFFLPQYLLRMNMGRNPFIASRLYLNTAVYGLLFYINYFWLIPRLFLKNKRFRYLIAALIVAVGCYFIMDVSADVIFSRLDRNTQPTTEVRRPENNNGRNNDRNNDRNNNGPKPPPTRQYHIYSYILNALLISGFSIGLRVSNSLKENEEQRKELEKEKLNSELAFLKNQISPHFFFNTLNNIYSLISINTTDAQESVHKLSKLMRYLLYESEQGTTRLSNEIDFMNNYIDLMKLRLSDKVTLDVSFPSDYQNINIPPLLFIPFIENAFKHGISYREKSYIKILMEADGNNILFNCKNSCGRIAEENDQQHPGIGLDNVKKRLKLLFPGKHKLTIDKDEHTFSVILKLNAENINV